MWNKQAVDVTHAQASSSKNVDENMTNEYSNFKSHITVQNDNNCKVIQWIALDISI